MRLEGLEVFRIDLVLLRMPHQGTAGCRE
jgi:hypothetical protein